MTNSRITLIILVRVCLLLLGLPVFARPGLAEPARSSDWATAVPNPLLKNLFQVDQGVYRSEQPDEEALEELEHSKHLKSVLSLRYFHSDKEKFKKLALQIFEVPINTWDIQHKQVVAALKILKNQKNQPILVHCQHGSDRTGLIVAMYRIAIQGWSKEQALKELRDGGFGFHSVWLNIPRYIENVDVEKFKREISLP